MKIGFYDDFKPCILKDDGVVDITEQVGHLDEGDPQLFMERIIGDFDSLRPALEAAAGSGSVTPLDQVRLRAPLPRPGKVLCGEGNYKEGVDIDPPKPLRTFFKSPDAVIGPGDTVVFPTFRPVIFNHEAELGVVIGKEAKQVSVEDALNYVFGYTTAVDVSARAPMEDEAEVPGVPASHYDKSFDTFLPIGPAITTADEIADPNNLQVKYYVNGKLRQDYNTSDMESGIANMIASLSHIMTLKPGDLIMGGTNHGNLGPLQDGDFGEIEIEGLGRHGHHVVDSMKRTWDADALRDPALNAANREAQRGQPQTGSWPFQAKSG